jgi:hypothetical protein
MSSCLFYTDCNPEMPVVYYLMVISCLLLHLSLDELVWLRAPKVSQILSEGNKLKEQGEKNWSSITKKERKQASKEPPLKIH